MYKIFVTRKIPEAGIKLLKEQGGLQIKISPHDRVLTKKEIIKMGKGSDALLSLLTDTIDGEIMDGIGKQLKIIANYAVGFNNINVPEAKKRGIAVTNTPVPEMSESVAEHTFALLMALAKRIVEADKFTRAKKFQGWSPTLFLGADLINKVLGIVGLGAIGKRVAQMATGSFKMKVLYYDVKRDESFEKECGATFTAMPELLRNSDFVSIHVPLLPSTKYLINDKEFALMKKTAYLINTSRGPIVREKALLKVLKSKKIAGAALDVFECEPAIDCDLSDKLELRKMDNVVITPHTASATNETRNAMSVCAARNIIAASKGEAPPNLVK